MGGVARLDLYHSTKNVQPSYTGFTIISTTCVSNKTQNQSSYPEMHVIIMSYVSSEFLTCRLLKWLLDHPMKHARTQNKLWQKVLNFAALLRKPRWSRPRLEASEQLLFGSRRRASRGQSVPMLSIHWKLWGSRIPHPDTWNGVWSHSNSSISFLSGNGCRQEFKAPWSGRTFKTLLFRNWPQVQYIW